MQRRGFLVTASIIFATGVVLGFVAFGADTNSPTLNPNLPKFPARVGRHLTHAGSESAIGSQNAPQVQVQTELGPADMPAPTRTSFMANWSRAAGALGYRLDVSTNPSFTNYVNGYHDLDVGNVTGRVVTGLSGATTYYYRVRAYDSTGTTGSYSEVITTTTSAGVGMIIDATYDSSITSNPNAAAIEAMINRTISIYESLFSDPITIQVLFRYATTQPDGTPLGAGVLGESDYVIYTVPWNDYISALRADAKTGNDNLANASLPGSALSQNIVPSSANGRAVGLNTPPSMFGNGSIGNGGPYDGIVTLNSAEPWQFTRPPGSGSWDAQTTNEHEVDEVIGLGSYLNITGNDLRPQDLFSWSSAGVRNTSSSGRRYFSINGGSSDIVDFNQDPTGDFGDWSSDTCPQTHPYVQNAFGCAGQYSDVTVTSPEGINLDVIGYNLVNSPVAAAAPTDFNGDGKPDYVLYNGSTRQTYLWYLNNNLLIGKAAGPTLSTGWQLGGVADLNRDGHPDYVLFNPTMGQSMMWYLNKNVLIRTANGPTFSTAWQVAATGDFNKDGKPDLVLYNSSTQQTYIWYLNNNVLISKAPGPTLPAGYRLVGVADFNGDGHPDYLLFNPSTRQSQIWYLSGVSLVTARYGPTIAGGYELVGTADFNRDGHPDYLLFNPSTGQTYIWYLNNNVLTSKAAGPTIPPGWSVVAP